MTQPTGSSSPARTDRSERTDRQHVLRIALIWLVLSVISMVLVYFVWGPHMPPGKSSDQARVQQDGNRILATIATPVFVFVWVYLGYVLTNWRVKVSTPVDEVGDGPPLKGHRGFQATWLAVTTVTVLGLFVFGTVDLARNNGAGTGSGQSPIWTPAGYDANATKSKLLVVQVIGQQWRWTFRYPQYGGLETSEMVVPAGQEVQYSVTSLDVIHSFWAINLGIKADANPGVNNIAFGTADKIGSVNIRCDELCGLYHGSMNTTGRVVSAADFKTWVTNARATYQQLIPFLPPYADIYLPQSDGGYYDPGQDPLPSGPPPGPASPSVIP
jgi:cytochrome c oxidase subunit 2